MSKKFNEVLSPQLKFEHEYDYVLKGVYDDEPALNPDEVKAFKWITFEALFQDLKLNPDQYTFWFKEIIRLNFI